MEERKISLRNHAELFASELDEVALQLGNIIDDLDANPEDWTDDDVCGAMRDLYDAICVVAEKSWELENMLSEKEIGKMKI